MQREKEPRRGGGGEAIARAYVTKVLKLMENTAHLAGQTARAESKKTARNPLSCYFQSLSLICSPQK